MAAVVSGHYGASVLRRTAIRTHAVGARTHAPGSAKRKKSPARAMPRGKKPTRCKGEFGTPFRIVRRDKRRSSLRLRMTVFGFFGAVLYSIRAGAWVRAPTSKNDCFRFFRCGSVFDPCGRVALHKLRQPNQRFGPSLRYAPLRLRPQILNYGVCFPSSGLSASFGGKIRLMSSSG